MEDDLRERTMDFALRVRLVRALPGSTEGRAVAGQLVRCGTSVGANYHAARRARSTREFVAKLGIVVEEADGCGFWLELIMRDDMLPCERVQPLYDEEDQLAAILVKARQTARHRMR